MRDSNKSKYTTVALDFPISNIIDYYSRWKSLYTTNIFAMLPIRCSKKTTTLFPNIAILTFI
jgi:hypothetical protein